jgi:hypothetical protein
MSRLLDMKADVKTVFQASSGHNAESKSLLLQGIEVRADVSFAHENHHGNCGYQFPKVLGSSQSIFTVPALLLFSLPF